MIDPNAAILLQHLEIIMSQRHNYTEIASDWSLWVQYVDPDAAMTRAEFDAMPLEQRIAQQVEAFGPEQRTWSVQSTAGVDMGEYISDSEDLDD